MFADFDERTADDWDVDMSVYYEPGAGDKDARDFVAMREEAMLRSGQKEPVIEKGCIGQFEKFSKVSLILSLAVYLLLMAFFCVFNSLFIVSFSHVCYRKMDAFCNFSVLLILINII